MYIVSQSKHEYLLSRDGQTWVLAYDREGIPSATLFEDAHHALALFASDEDKVSLGSSAAMIRNGNGTFCHRLIHPTCEERGHLNDNLQSWMGAYRLHTLSTLSPESIKLL